jgi:ubiquinone/menaquinone biosynthesis C-methylase UbiE
VSVSGYVHGYGTPEQERLVAQAEHWRRPLICDGTSLDPGSRVLEVGCGVGAVLAVLGHEYPGIELTGVDIEPRQLEFARTHLERSGVEATLIEGDAAALPLADTSFDHVWTMWLLEHLADPVAALREARRVLVPDGWITAIEVDYGTCFATPATSALQALFAEVVDAMAAAGWSDAGTRLPGWLADAGFREIHEGIRPFEFRDDELRTQAINAADVMESALGPRPGIAELRALSALPGARLGWVMHKSTGVR